MQSAPATPKVTREYLLTHGFKQSATNPDIFALQNARLGNVSRDLGFPLAALRPTKNQPPDSDVRTVKVGDWTFVVRSEVRDEKGRISRHSLDNPDAICTVSVSLKQTPARPARHYLATDSVPRLRIKSVTVPEDRSKPLQISFELVAEGTTPLAVEQLQFGIRLSTADQPYAFLGEPSFPKETPRVISVQPGKPITLTVSTSKKWSDLRSGEYIVRITVGGMKAPAFDYQWARREAFSDEYKLVIK